MGKITGLKLVNFTCFAKLDLAFSSGINVLIGVNGTGKTHILKVLYAACATSVEEEGRDRVFSDKLRRVFSPYEGNITRLCRSPIHFHDEPYPFHAPKEADFEHAVLHIGITIDKDSKQLNYSIFMRSMPGQGYEGAWTREVLESVYIPVKEMLAHAPGFRSLYAKREIAFEEVYLDILDQAYLPKLKTPLNQAYEIIHEKLGRALGGVVILKGEHFFLKTQQGEIEFSLMAEGLRKLALIGLLIQNGTLKPGSILFWDEPEANLNPSLMGLVVDTLLELQRQGVQVFLTTHNYVLLKEFDLRKQKDDFVQYVALFRDEFEAVSAQVTEDYLAIDPNAIADTLDYLYDREIKRSLSGF